MRKKNKILREEDIDVYNEDYVEELLEDDEISAEERGFMVGYNSS